MNKQLLIATHNSATGEKCGSFLSWLLTPFAKCQSKTIKEQYDAGCRMFDIRIKYINKSWKCAHGLWISDKYASVILREIDSFKEPCYVTITYEGNLKTNEEREEYKFFCTWAKKVFTNIYWGDMSAKYNDDNLSVDWVTIIPGDKSYNNKQGFVPLDGKHWQTILPIPWLWNKIYTRKHGFNSEYFTFVDFL